MADARLTRLALVGVALVLAVPVRAQDDEAEVRAAFDRYRTAAVERDGRTAAELVTRSSLNASAQHVALALDADSATVATLPLVDRYTVLAYRHRVSADTLRSLDGAAAYAYGIAKGWTDGVALRLHSLGTVEVRGDSAWAEVRIGGRAAPDAPAFPFVREAGVWRLDAAAVTERSQPAFDAQVAESGMTEVEFILYALRVLSGRPVPHDVWNPVGRGS